MRPMRKMEKGTDLNWYFSTFFYAKKLDKMK